MKILANLFVGVDDTAKGYAMSKAMIGHNQGPLQGEGFRRVAWKKARAELLGNKVPLQIVRMRVKRAQELGLSYPQYASVLMGTGRDITAFLFTVDGLQLRLRRELEMPGRVRDKLQGLAKTELLSFVPSGENPTEFRAELTEVAGVPFVQTTAEPEPSASWAEAKAAIRAALDPIKLPGGAVIMVGSRSQEAEWAVAGKLARFLPSTEYFSPA